MSNGKPRTSEKGNLKASLSALAEATGDTSQVSEASVWALPSGEDLLHYALNGGFLAPGILGSTEDSAAGRRRSRQTKSEQRGQGVR